MEIRFILCRVVEQLEPNLGLDSYYDLEPLSKDIFLYEQDAVDYLNTVDENTEKYENFTILKVYRK